MGFMIWDTVDHNLLGAEGTFHRGLIGWSVLKRRCRPFGCLAIWTLHAEFKGLVRENWKNDVEVEVNLERFQDVVQEHVYGDIFVCKRKLVSEVNQKYRYFHGCKMARRKWNRIEGLRVESDEWCFDGDILNQHAVKFFRYLYSMDYSVNGLLSCHSKFPIISMVDMDSLLLTTSDEEIRRAVFSMAPLKAPGDDKFNVNFYQSN
ncbi:hypothetical protein GOBAR_DD32010 [Gossypium barbadense]|nr:hypothetical protein GOBAR_DD32010 [Gossypium barbadense]